MGHTGARLLPGLRRRLWPSRGSRRLQPLHRRAPHITGGTRGRRARSPAQQQPQPVSPATPRTTAKEGVEKAKGTEQMIEKEAGKEPAEGGGGGSHRLGDAQEMCAVVLAGFGGLSKLRVTRKAMPEPQDGEPKIRVKARSNIRALLACSIFRAFGARGGGEGGGGELAAPRRARCPWRGLGALPPSARPGRLSLRAARAARRMLEAGSRPPQAASGGTGGDQAPARGGERWAVAPGAPGLEGCADGALGGVGQLSCQERGSDHNMVKKS